MKVTQLLLYVLNVVLWNGLSILKLVTPCILGT